MYGRWLYKDNSTFLFILDFLFSRRRTMTGWSIKYNHQSLIHLNPVERSIHLNIRNDSSPYWAQVFHFSGRREFYFFALIFSLSYPSVFQQQGNSKKVDTIIIDGNNKNHLKAVNKGNKCCRTLGQGYRLRKCVSPLYDYHLFDEML